MAGHISVGFLLAEWKLLSLSLFIILFLSVSLTIHLYLLSLAQDGISTSVSAARQA
jgi:hypothetical protein